jgi:hypothetical protein
MPLTSPIPYRLVSDRNTTDAIAAIKDANAGQCVAVVLSYLEGEQRANVYAANRSTLFWLMEQMQADPRTFQTRHQRVTLGGVRDLYIEHFAIGKDAIDVVQRMVG